MGKLIREIPSYYNDFECTGNTTCIDTCCIVWDLPVDDKTRDYYLNYEGEFGEYLRSNIYSDENGQWFIKLKEGGVCPFLTDDKLCNVRLKAGESAQIKICEIYPREREIMAGNYRQNRLLIACSEAARLLYTQPGDRLEFIRTEEETDDEVSDGLKERTALLLAFRDGLVEGLQSGAFDDSLFKTYESTESFKSLLDDAVYCEGREPGETLLKTAREIVAEAGEWRERFYRAVPEAHTWLRKTAAYFAHRQLLDTIQDGSIEGPLISVFRSVHILELVCLAQYKLKGTFDVDDMIVCAHVFSATFEISMHNVNLMKEVRNRERDEVYPDNENSELRPFLY